MLYAVTFWLQILNIQFVDVSHEFYAINIEKILIFWIEKVNAL